MKKISFLILILLALVSSAQEKKHLNIKDAVGYYRGLYPQNKRIQWVEGADKTIAFSEKGILFQQKVLHVPNLKRLNIMLYQFHLLIRQ